MSKRIVMMGLLVLFVLMIKAQDKLNYKEVDTQSYQLFQDKNWKELIRFSKDARKQGIDFYYLQMRTGIAYYNQKKYRMASHWFLEAYKNDKYSDLLQEYLYYSLVFSGRIYEARNYAADFSDEVKEKIKFKKSGITRTAYEAGYVFNSDFDDLAERDFSTEVDLGYDYGVAYLLNDYNFHSLDLNHVVGHNFSLNHNLTYLSLNREAVIDWGERNSSPLHVNQFQYFINPVWVVGKKVHVSPALSLIAGKREDYIGGYVYTSPIPNKVYNLSEVNFNDIVFSTSVWSDFKNFSPGLELNIGDVNHKEFLQASAWVCFYPLSNASLYFVPRIYFKSKADFGDMGWNAFGISAGGQIGKLHLNGQYMFGEMDNFVEYNGYVISNFPGKVDRKIMGNVQYPIGKNMQLVLRYINHNIIEEYQVYVDGIWDRAMEYNFSKHTISGGISWIF